MSKSCQGTDWTNVGLVSIVLLFLFWNKGKEGYKCGVGKDGKAKVTCTSGTLKKGNWGCTLKTPWTDATTCYYPSKSTSGTYTFPFKAATVPAGTSLVVTIDGSLSPITITFITYCESI